MTEVPRLERDIVDVLLDRLRAACASEDGGGLPDGGYIVSSEQYERLMQYARTQDEDSWLDADALTRGWVNFPRVRLTVIDPAAWVDLR